jgi:multidrug efflux pump subunit AcrA (membrane-fusion protein)
MARETEVIERPSIVTRRSQLPRYLAIAAAVLVVLFAIAGMRGRRSSGVTSAPPSGAQGAAAPEEPVIPVVAAVVQPANLSESIRVTGNLATDENVTLTSKLAGKVAMLSVREGDTVRAGQVVAQLDASEQRAQRDRAAAALRAAQARLQQTIVGGRVKDVGAQGEHDRARAALASSRARLAQVEHSARIQDTSAETRVRSAKAGLASARERVAMLREGSRKQELQMAEQAVRRAQIDMVSAERNFNRREQLLKEGAISAEDAEESRRLLELARVQLANAEEQRSMVQEGPRSEEVRMAEQQVTQAEQALQEAEANRAQREISREEVAAAREAVRQAQAAERSARAGLLQGRLTQEDVRTAQATVQQLRADLAYYDELLRQTRIIAPVSGTVTRKFVNVGEFVSGQNAKIISLVSRDSLYFEALVSERQLQKLRTGQPARISVDVRPGRVYPGVVREILPVAEGLSRSSRVRVSLAGGRDLPVGAFARATVPVARKSGVISVPADAVLSEAGVNYVFAIEGDRAKRRNVQLGIREGDRVEITAGLKPGNRIVTAGSPAVVDGTRVSTQQ